MRSPISCKVKLLRRCTRRPYTGLNSYALTGACTSGYNARRGHWRHRTCTAYGEAVTSCHRMVVTWKRNRSPRRTVGFSPLNKHCARKTFSSESPFHLARRVSWKPVTDAWNGYHSVPLRDSDRHLTTFITPFDRWRYTRAPQGILSSGNEYNRHFDEIVANSECKERIDDTIHCYVELLNYWRRTIDYLLFVGRAWVVLILDDFQFAQRTLDFAGFRVSNAKMEPLPKYLDAIRDFATSTTDVRS